ncbi:MAG: SDR family NAD(P)-dependent oxidoreductase [Candidatus Heimdallarchaeaceae archaeon]
MDLQLKGRKILVTGGTGGIGEEIVHLLYDEGAIIGMQFFKNEQKLKEIKEKYSSSDRILFLQGDLRKEGDVKKIFDIYSKNFGRIDALVANAGIWPSRSVLTSRMSLEQWENTLRLNLTGVFLCVRAFFRNLEQYQGETASLVLIGSTAGSFGEAGHADYSASKAALMYGLTKTWKNEIIYYAPHGRVNTIAPGWVRTKMAEESLKNVQLVKRVLQTIPLKKIAQPRDIANLVAVLISDQIAGHITGETIFVHGGMEGRVLFDKSELD